MDTQELNKPEKIFPNWDKNRNSTVNKMNDKKSSVMTWSQKMLSKWMFCSYIRRMYNLKMVYTYICTKLVRSMDIKKDELLTLSGVKIRIGQIKLKKTLIVVFCRIYKMNMAEYFVLEKLMDITEDPEVPPEWVNKRKWSTVFQDGVIVLILAYRLSQSL